MPSWHAQGLNVLFLPLVYGASACNHGNFQPYTQFFNPSLLALVHCMVTNAFKVIVN
jgi:hypothetical protein